MPGTRPGMTRELCVSVRIPAAASVPILEFPGLELPRRKRLHPPRLEPLGPVTETRGFLGHDGVEVDDARRTALGLARRLADHIDIFWLIGQIGRASCRG